MRRRTIAMITGAALIAAGCAGFNHRERIPPPPPTPPPGYHAGANGAVIAPTGATAAAAELPAVRIAGSHRQYFDQRHRRYYYFDPSRRAYFWEDGTPRT